MPMQNNIKYYRAKPPSNQVGRRTARQKEINNPHEQEWKKNQLRGKCFFGSFSRLAVAYNWSQNLYWNLFKMEVPIFASYIVLLRFCIE